MEIQKEQSISTLHSKQILIIANFLDFHSRINLISTNSHFKAILYDPFVDLNYISCLRSFWNVENFLQKIENPIINIKEYNSRNIWTHFFQFIRLFSEKTIENDKKEERSKLVFYHFVNYLVKRKDKIQIHDCDLYHLLNDMKSLYVYFPQMYNLEIKLELSNISNCNLFALLNKNIKFIKKLNIVFHDSFIQATSIHLDNLFNPDFNHFIVESLELSVKESNHNYNYFNNNIEKTSYNLSPIIKYFTRYSNTLKKVKFSHKISLDVIADLIGKNTSSITDIFYYYLTEEDFNKFNEMCIMKSSSIKKLKISFQYCNETMDDMILIVNKLKSSGIKRVILFDSNIDSSDFDDLFKVTQNCSFSILLGNNKRDKLLDYIDFVLMNNTNEKFNFYYDPDNYFLPDKQLLFEKLDILKQEKKFQDGLREVSLYINGKKGKKVLGILLKSLKELTTLKKIVVKSSSLTGEIGEALLQLVKSNEIISKFMLEIIDTFIFSLNCNDVFTMKLINYNESYFDIAEHFIINNNLDKLSVCFILYPELINSMDFISQNIWNNFPNICSKVSEVFFYDTVSEKIEDDNYDFIELCEVIKLFPNLEMLYLNSYCREETWDNICDTLTHLNNLKYFNGSSRVSDDFDFFSYDCAIRILEGLSNSKDLFSLCLKGKFNEEFFITLQGKLKVLAVLSKIVITGIIDLSDDKLDQYVNKIQESRPHMSIVIKRL
jgi:hypothetical protein